MQPHYFNNFSHTSKLEWLETNGLGGYASSTVSGAHTRRYHGLLIAALEPPVKRHVLLSKLDETLVVGSARYELGSNRYPGVIHPAGCQYLKDFQRHFFPEFIYEAGGVTIKKTIAALHGENTTLILYEVLAAREPFRMELLPLGSFRDHHALSRARDDIFKGYVFADGIFRTKNYQDSPEVFIGVPESIFLPAQSWFYNFEYEAEQERGEHYQEDLFNHGKFEVALHQGKKLGVVISAENPEGRDAFKLFKKELRRRQKLTVAFPEATLQKLTLAADQFIVKRGTNLKTIIAGYHWFTDWGRDSMISLPGLCLVTGRFDDAKKMLKAFAESVHEGLLPNRFPDKGEEAEYNTVDATLWFFVAIKKYLQYTGDAGFVKSIVPALKKIIEYHFKGTRYNIHVDDDGLLYAGEEGVQLTWMDAKVDGHVFTPRHGKAVEVNALWYNALCIMAELVEATGGGQKSVEGFRGHARQVKENFNALFWNAKKNCLYDFIDGQHKNDDIRPNQIFALSLPYKLLAKEKAEKVLEVVRQKLLTPVGLRSLSPDNPAYKPMYTGDRWQRDGAYHQGTVWSYLVGPYIDALVEVKGRTGKKEALQLLANFLPHLQEAGIGSISEIFDGALPHQPRGCMAQAWSIAEVLRVSVEYKLLTANASS